MKTLNIILPVGISFYTFQTVGYTIDVYRKKIEACDNYFDFAAYISFFPQLVAGPIERASNIIPQLKRNNKLSLEKLTGGSFLILWGIFKKVVIADNIAPFTDFVFGTNGSAPLDSGVALLGGYAFAIQIYCDFSGYTDIARGVAKYFGIDLMINFNSPYFADSLQEFWRKWHISLSTWLRDYLYLPLGGSKVSSFLTYRNILITMLLGGLWHGASWMFLLWGGYHGLLLIVERYLKRNVQYLTA